MHVLQTHILIQISSAISGDDTYRRSDRPSGSYRTLSFYSLKNVIVQLIKNLSVNVRTEIS
jgi:hypothetical protein